MKIGIMQGRLLPPVNNHIQEFPSEWEQEIDLIQKHGLAHVEWLITKKSFTHNPIFKENDFKLQPFVSSICVDNLVDERIVDRDYFFSNLKPVCQAARNHGIKKITVPILEESSMENEGIRKVFSELMSEISKQYPELEFCFEAELDCDSLLEILKKSPNFYVTYDTGNITSYGEDHEVYIRRLSKFIKNVHLKDRTYGATTVEPGTGNTDFKLIFHTLKKIGYNGPYTIQTARSQAGDEVRTILRHKKLFQEIYNEE